MADLFSRQLLAQGFSPKRVADARRLQQEQNALAQILNQQQIDQNKANLRATRLDNTQRARQMAQKPSNTFETIQGRDGNSYQIEVAPNGQVVGTPSMVGGLGQAPRNNNINKIPEAARQFLPPEILTNPNGVDSATFNQAAAQAVRQMRDQDAPRKYTDIDWKSGRAIDQNGNVVDLTQQPGWSNPKSADQENLADTKTSAFGKAADKVFDILGESNDLVMGSSGAISGWLPGTNRSAMDGALETMKANIGFEQLNAMRRASPTGGALGSVSEGERRALEAALGTLDPNNFRNAQEFMSAVADVEALFMQTIHGRPFEPRQFGQPSSGDVDDVVGLAQSILDESDRREQLAPRMR